MRIVGLGTSELVVRDGWPRAGGSRTAWKILHPTAPAVIADDDVELAVRAKLDHPAIVVAAERLPFISLKSMQLDRSSEHGHPRQNGRFGCRARAHRPDRCDPRRNWSPSNTGKPRDCVEIADGGRFPAAPVLKQS